MSNKRILIVEDDEDLLQLVNDILTQENFTIKALSDPTDFIEIAGTFRPNLIIMDYKLGKCNGGELCRVFKGRREFQAIPVVIFSAYTHPNLDFRAYGCDEVIAKPFDLEFLLQTVRRLINIRVNLNIDPNSK